MSCESLPGAWMCGCWQWCDFTALKNQGHPPICVIASDYGHPENHSYVKRLSKPFIVNGLFVRMHLVGCGIAIVQAADACCLKRLKRKSERDVFNPRSQQTNI
jgi:hypothetical protein